MGGVGDGRRQHFLFHHPKIKCMSKEIKPYRLLVVEDNSGDYVLLEQYLILSKLPVEKIAHADSMAATLPLVKDDVFDVAFLDLTLPDSSGVDSVITLDRLIPHTPIVVFSGMSTIEIAVESISFGAQDYLIKGEFDEKLLAKSVQYSIERKRTFERLRESNERYEFVNKATNDTIWEWDYLTKEGLWGDGIINTFGYSKDKLKFDENWVEEYVHPSDKEHMTNIIESCIKTGNENWQDECRFRCADGTYKEVFDRGFILYNENNKPYRMIGAMTDLTEKKILERKLAEQQSKQLRIMAEVTIQAQEKEKNQLGKELHDNINQILATIKMFLGMAKAKENIPLDLVEQSYEYVNIAMEETRKLAHSLVAPSLGDIGLKEALEELVGNANMISGMHVQLYFDENYYEKKLDENKELMFYRIMQEQMNNIIEHAQATEVTITFKTVNKNIGLSVTDNGVGFDSTQNKKGIGLKNIASRVELYSGSLNIISALGKGCTLEVCIPC